jgi:ubiquinone/menaquinone biosynthesis C-methylase UbiE
MRDAGGEIFDGLVSGYDLGMLPLELVALRRLRRRAFSGLEGRVMELGVGTGVNLSLYGPGASVVAVDASRPMLDAAVRRPTRAKVWPIQADAQALPFADGSFESVTASLVFCSISDPAQGLAEARRVLRKPTAGEREAGRLVLVEHTRGSGLGAWLTDLLNPLWMLFSRVCHLNRETVQTVVEAGFRLVRLETRVLGIFRLIEAVREG